MSKASRHIILVGNPNSGKTTLFNSLTGLNQKTSNLPGTTVEKKSGFFQFDSETFRITDLPGTYSLFPKSADEQISVNELLAAKEENAVIVYVADSGNLHRNLLLFTQVSDLGMPTLLVLNMSDLAEKKGFEIDSEGLSADTGVLVYKINSRTGEGIKELLKGIKKTDTAWQKSYFQETFKVNPEFSEYKTFKQLVEGAKSVEEELLSEETKSRYTLIEQLLSKNVTKITRKVSLRTRLDEYLLHPVWGFAIFYLVLFILFQSLFRLADYPVGWIESFFASGGEWLSTAIPQGKFNSLICEGLLPGISGVVVFLPQIILLFAIIAVLEDSGYMSRVSFMTDRLMRQFGLSGKSVVPLIGGMACAIPSIMAARNIENYRDRLITILVTPLMSCSARLPVYTLLISLIPANSRDLGWIDLRGLLLLLLYLSGFIAALFFAYIFKLIIKRRGSGFFILELPDYRWPTWNNVFNTVRSKAMDFILNAGKIILVVSLLLWVLAGYGPGDSFQEIDLKYADYQGADKEQVIASEKLESSYIGHLGKWIEPAIRPLGYDWKIGIAILSSFAAREVFNGTLATIYNVGGSGEDFEKLSELMAKQTHSDGSPVFTLPAILSLLVFYAFAMQCISTLVVTYRETGGIKWPLVQFLYMGIFAYLCSLLVYQIF